MTVHSINRFCLAILLLAPLAIGYEAYRQPVASARQEQNIEIVFPTELKDHYCPTSTVFRVTTTTETEVYYVTETVKEYVRETKVDRLTDTTTKYYPSVVHYYDIDTTFETQYKPTFVNAYMHTKLLNTYKSTTYPIIK